MTTLEMYEQRVSISMQRVREVAHEIVEQSTDPLAPSDHQLLIAMEYAIRGAMADSLGLIVAKRMSKESQSEEPTGQHHTPTTTKE